MNEELIKEVQALAKEQRELGKRTKALARRVEAALQLNGWEKEQFWWFIERFDERGGEIAKMLGMKATQEDKIRKMEPFIGTIERNLKDSKVQVARTKPDWYEFGYPKCWIRMVEKGRGFRIWTPDGCVYGGHSICFYKNGMAHFFRGMRKIQMPKELIASLEAQCTELSKKPSPEIARTVQADKREAKRRREADRREARRRGKAD